MVAEHVTGDASGIVPVPLAVVNAACTATGAALTEPKLMLTVPGLPPVSKLTVAATSRPFCVQDVTLIVGLPTAGAGGGAAFDVDGAGATAWLVFAGGFCAVVVAGAA